MNKFQHIITHFLAFGCMIFWSNCKAQSEIYTDADKFSLMGQPGCVAVKDVNEDEHLDIIVTDEEFGRLYVLLGNGKGKFSQAKGSPFSAGNQPGDIVFGDFNEDQKIDMAIANHESDYITILMGNGKGQFSDAANSPVKVESNPHPHGIASGDFDGDGIMDLAIESWQDDEVIILLGDGQGGFPDPHHRLGVGKVPYYKLRTWDLNGDARSDIITSNWGASGISILLTKDSGGFYPYRKINTPPSPFAVAIGDINGDGYADVAVAHRRGNANEQEADRISFLLGDGKGKFENKEGLNVAIGKSPTSLAIGDFNGDKIGDVASANYASGDVTIILGSPTEFSQMKGSPFKVGKGPSSIVLADLNEDGKADIITANSESKNISVVFAPW